MIAMDVQNNNNNNIINMNNNYSIQCQALEYRSPTIPPSTGIGFLDHMLEQLYSHAQIGIDLQIQNTIISTTSVVPTTTTTTTVHPSTTTTTTPGGDGMDPHNHSDSSQKNRYAHLVDQTEFLALIGTAVGTALTTLQQEKWNESNSSSSSRSSSDRNSRRTSTFACPLDEALTICILEQQMNGSNSRSSSSANTTTTTTDMVEGRLVSYTLPPYGIYPKPTGRTCIGTLQTKAIESFWIHLAKSMPNLTIQLIKVRGINAHHIVESSFKAFARAIRNLFDGIDTVVHGMNGPDDASSSLLQSMYGPTSINYITSMNLHRKASIVRTTKETSIRTDIQFDGGQTGIQIHTGIVTLDQFLYEMARMANISLHVTCQGDLWIDEHHTAEDVAISIGQVMYEALGTKAGLNRMWYASSNVVVDDDNNVDHDDDDDNSHHKIHVTMDLSNRPCFTHNLHSLETVEMIGDLTCEMLEHVLDSIVINARMTVHIVEEVTGQQRHEDVVVVHNVMMATARAFGQALNYCSLVDIRRAGTTASSKGTLSA
jgi:imidazoleglycerol-phosphate dehydratase